MRIAASVFLVSVCCLISSQLIAADASLDVSEDTLNRFITEMGHQSDSGVGYLYTANELDPAFEICEPVGFIDCPGLFQPGLGFDMERIPLVACHSYGGGVAVMPSSEPVAWQWWISNVHIELEDGSMRMTATVQTNVDGFWNETTGSVDVKVLFNSSNNRLMLVPDEFRVHLATDTAGTFLRVDPVDVASIYTLSVPAHPQKMDVALPGGGTRKITGAVESVAGFSVSAHNLKVAFNVKFTRN